MQKYFIFFGSTLKKRPEILFASLIILFWHFVSINNLISPSLLASPKETYDVIVHAFSNSAKMEEKVHIHAYHTISRALEGWFWGICFGLMGGIIIGRTAFLYKGCEPIIEYIRAIPPILMFPLFLVAFDYNESAYVLSITYGCLPIMLLTVARGTFLVSTNYLDILRVFNVQKGVRFFITLMEISPSAFLGARITLSIAIIISVVTEMVFTPRSGFALGALARDSEIAFDTPMFYSCIIIIGLFGYLTNMVLKRIEKNLGFLDHNLN